MTSATNEGEKRHTHALASDHHPSLDHEDVRESRSTGERWSIQPGRYRKIVFIAGTLLALIVLTGAAVRLTESGLGCEDWPTCNEDEVVPEWQFHSWIEFGNRLLSGVVAAAVGVAALAAYRREPRRQPLITLAWGLVVLVALQVVLGGATVLLDLHPLVVGVHFLLSMVLLWNVVVLWVKADPAFDQDIDGSSLTELTVFPTTKQLVNGTQVIVALAMITGVLGTLVTGTGPHGGDARADRLPFDLEIIAQVHSGGVWIFLATAAGLSFFLHRAIDRSKGHAAAAKTSRFVLLSAVAQGAIGYAQFFTGVPALLVELHILGAILVWTTVVLLHQRVKIIESPL